MQTSCAHIGGCGHSFDDTVIVPSLALVAGVPAQAKNTYFSAPEIDLSLYDRIIVCLSGGKDSIACVLRLLDMGADRSKIELWHHDVDGREGSTLMDWPFMRDYCRQFASAMGMPIYFSWLEGGFEGEMLKENSFSRPHHVETPDGKIILERDTQRTQPGTRLMFPQQSPSLQTRWCSSALKIDVGRRALNNQDRFLGRKTLFVTGERREESANRAKYQQFEPHACDRRDGRKARHVDAWRAVLHWSEEQVWDALARHRVIAPVPYRLGWSRSSCMNCIYNSARTWATIALHFPKNAKAVAGYEDRFNTTISRKRINVLEQAAGALPFNVTDLEALQQANEEMYRLPIFVPEGAEWVMPAGAFGKENCGSD